jgi:ERCC4-related helicase
MTATPGANDEELEEVLDSASALADSSDPTLRALGQHVYGQVAEEYKARTPPRPGARPPS